MNCLLEGWLNVSLYLILKQWHQLQAPVDGGGGVVVIITVITTTYRLYLFTLMKENKGGHRLHVIKSFCILKDNKTYYENYKQGNTVYADIFDG